MNQIYSYIRCISLMVLMSMLALHVAWAQPSSYTCGATFSTTNTGSSISFTFTPDAGHIIQISGLNAGFSVVAPDVLALDGIAYNNSAPPGASIYSSQTDGSILGSFTDNTIGNPPYWTSTVNCVCDDNPAAPAITTFPNPICPDRALTDNDFTITGGKVDGYGTPSPPLYLHEYEHRYAPSTTWITGLPSPPLTPGTLEVHARLKRNDTPGCTSPFSSLVQIGVTTLPSATVSGQSNVSCYAGSDGSITITASGGTGPYQFSLDNGANYVSGANPYTFSGLQANTYYPRVKDAIGCESPSCP